jgi:hypothetical protein
MAAQQLAAQQAQALQAAVNAGAQPNAPHRNPFWGVQGLGGGGMPPPMMGGLPANFYPAMQAAQENNTAMVATAKLGYYKDNAEGNSPLVVRSSVRKFSLTGGVLTVAQWTRKCVEENLEWLVKLSKRRHNADCILLAYGDGCETLVLMDDHVNKMPDDIRRVLKIGVGVSMVAADFKGDETKLAKQGVLQPSDSIWEHLRFEQLDSSKDKKEKCLFIHTGVQIWSDSVEGRRRVLQLMTAAPQSPLLAKCYIPNPAFEQQAMSAWKMAQTGAAGQPFSPPEDETVITFNPKELILLEKAFDNLLTATDMKADAVKWSENDTIKCQRIIKRAHDEFVMIGPAKKRRKKNDKPKKDGVVKEKADAKPAKEKADTKPKDTPKSPAKKPASAKKSKAAKAEEAEKPEERAKEEEKKEISEDSDDEPIRKLKETSVPKKAAEKSPTRSSRRSSKSSTPKAKTPKAKTPKTEEDPDKKRGRPRGSKNESSPEDEKRSSSKPKKDESVSKRRKSKSKK